MTLAITSQNVINFIVQDSRNVGFLSIRQSFPGANQPLLDAANNVSGPGFGSVAGDPISATDFLDLLDATEFNALTTAQLAQVNTLMAPGTITMGSSRTQEKLNAILANYATSLAAVQAKYTRSGSPWEMTFGKGSVADNETLNTARNSGSGNNF